MPLAFEYVDKKGEKKSILIDRSPFMIGSLLSNQLILDGNAIEPIHALVEYDSDARYKILDLGSQSGIYLNNQKIDVEVPFKISDEIKIGSISLVVTEQELKKEVAKKSEEIRDRRSSRDLLFRPRESKPTGDVLEAVAYWGDTVLEVEHFHPTYKNYQSVVIGDPAKSNFIAVGDQSIDRHVLAEVTEEGYQIHLLPEMTARIRTESKVIQANAGSYSLKRKDIAHISYGGVRYFLLCVKPPVVEIPKEPFKDPFFLGLMGVAAFFYLILFTSLLIVDPVVKKEASQEVWAVANLPEKKEQKEPLEHVVELKKVEKVIKKPEPPKPKVKPVEPEAKKELPKPKPREVVPLNKSLQNKPPEPPKAPEKAKEPPKPPPAAGGGQNKPGGARQGQAKISVNGAEGAKAKESSGVNLSALGLGVGKVQSFGGAGAIHTNFKSSAGGMGAGSGSATKNFGLGGVGVGSTLGLAGSSDITNSFGSAEGVIGGKGLGRFTGASGPAKVAVRASDPLVSGGLSQEEIMGVINKNINQIRHCYEVLLQSSPSANGKIKVQFVISLDGSIAQASVAQTTISDAEMNNCVVGRLKRWTFPKPRGSAPVTVNYPFNFDPL